MIDKSEFLQFDKIFPQSKGTKPSSKEEIIVLAHRVATALRKEREYLVKEQTNNNSSGFFPTTTQ